MIDINNVDKQGRPDLLNSVRAYELAKRILDYIFEDDPIKTPMEAEIFYLRDKLIEVEQHGVFVGRNEMGHRK